MNYLYYSATPLDSQNTSVLLDDAYRVLNAHKDAKIYFLVCNGFPNRFCEFNFEKSRHRCTECRLVNNLIFKDICKNDRFILIKLSDFININDYIFKEIKISKNLKDIKQLDYKGINIGYGIVSSFVSITRNIRPLFNADTITFFIDFIRSTHSLVDALFNIDSKFKINYIKVYNGRYGLIRPLVEFANYKKIHFSTFEKPAPYEKISRQIEYFDAMPHNIAYRTKFINESWEFSNAYNKKQIASDFYEKRRNCIAAADKTYINYQQKGLLPDNFDPQKRNFVIFNSSEDEIFSIDKDWDSKALLGSQVEGIRIICEMLKNHTNIHIYLRIHPNLKGLKYYYADSLKQSLSDLPNLTVISSTSPVSTYQLLDSCEKCIIFGSSVGVEANYWKIPSILLSGSYYYYLDVCYIPKSKEELYKLLVDNLVPKDILGSLKYSYAIMEKSLGYRYNYFDFNMGKIRFAGKELEYAKGIKILGSSNLYKFLCIFFRILNFKHHLSFRKRLLLYKIEDYG